MTTDCADKYTTVAKPTVSYTEVEKLTVSYTTTAKPTVSYTETPKPCVESWAILTEDEVEILHENEIVMVTEGALV